jgi:hypothetical protein
MLSEFEAKPQGVYESERGRRYWSEGDREGIMCK